jgi:hypothetical protein
MHIAPKVRLSSGSLDRQSPQPATDFQLSLVVPIHDEASNLAALHRRCRAPLVSRCDPVLPRAT